MIKNNLITLHIKRKQLPIFYLFFFIFLLSSGNSRLYAEENRAFNFSTLNLNNGLSQLSVLDICQDDIDMLQQPLESALRGRQNLPHRRR